MSARVWQATADLAAVWRSSPYVQDFCAGAMGRLSLCRTSGQHIAAQPFYLWRYLPTHPRYEYASSPSTDAWLEKCAHLDDAYTTLIEWMRSRLSGYPYPGAPQLTPPSPWTVFNVSMQVPWLAARRKRQLHTKATPPTIPFLEIAAATQLSVGARLGAAIASSPAAVEVDAAWRSLTTGDKAELRSVCATILRAQYPEPADVTGTEDFRELAWAMTMLDEAMRPLAGRAKKFTEALTAADRVIQQAAALFSQLIAYNEIRRLGRITLVEQPDGADGRTSVSSESLVLDHVRQFEILAFDHPYPRGVMLVDGVTETFGGEPSHVTTVVGYILPESEELAKLANQSRNI
jgi:hypothetical protein